VIFPGSYVGQALEVEDVILDKNRLINVRLGGAVAVTDDFLIGSLASGQFRRWSGRLLARLLALLLLLLAFPVLLLTAGVLKLFRRGPIFFRQEAVRLPTAPEERRWRTYELLSFDPNDPSASPLGSGVPCSWRALLLRGLPGLIHIVRGELSFVGVPPRSRAAIRNLPNDWQLLYLRAKAGIVTEAAVRSRETPDEDELYAAEAFYVATANWIYDLKLLLRFLARSLFSRSAHREIEAG
jgi:lipopolysaccharide/colanic/teichoic acid biosynthesis glycosyltransferase